MPSFRTALSVNAFWNGGYNSTITVPLTGAQVGDTVIILHGLNFANNANNDNGIPAITGSGITPTTRTSLTFNSTNSNAAFIAATTAVVTSADSPSFTAGCGNRGSAVVVGWAVLPGSWTFVSAATTGTTTTATSSITSPTVAAAAGDTWFGGFNSRWVNNSAFTLPAGTSGGVQLPGAVAACWEDLVAGDISGGNVAGRAATQGGSTSTKSAVSLVMRPPAILTPAGQFLPFF